jgi:hypothetical protein
VGETPLRLAETLLANVAALPVGASPMAVQLSGSVLELALGLVPAPTAGTQGVGAIASWSPVRARASPPPPSCTFQPLLPPPNPPTWRRRLWQMPVAAQP